MSPRRMKCAPAVILLLHLFVFFTTVTSEQDNVCHRPQLSANIEVKGLQRYYNPGATVVLTCRRGFTPILGPRKIVCSDRGEWSSSKIRCIPKRCTYPEPVSNGELYYEDVVYESTINYTCHEGYTLTGPDTAECLADGTWSSLAPVCNPVQCGLAPIPQFGMIVYDKTVRGNTTHYGLKGTYKCLPPNVLIGDARAACTANGNWTKTPECRVVTCAPPENIERGFMLTTRKKYYDYMETVEYGCNGDYVLDGNLHTVCQQNGYWSEKPSCKAPCSVDITRGRILYNGKKLWIEDLKPNRVLHNEIVSVYCMNKVRQCGYAVPTQCMDGKLTIPDCFEEPTLLAYTLSQDSLPSEIEQC